MRLYATALPAPDARFNVRGGIYTSIVAERRQAAWQPLPPVSLPQNG